MQSNQSTFKFATPRRSAIVIGLVCSGWLSAASAAPSCTSTLATPSDGVIPAGSTVDNNHADACFDNAVTPIVNNGTVNNNVGAGLTNAGVFTVNGSASLRNYGTFNNYAGSQFNLASNSFVRNYQTGVFTNNGTWVSEGSARNDGQWTNAVGATMEHKGSLDNSSGSTFTNNGIAKFAESATFAGGTFNNNGSLADLNATQFSSMDNSGTFNNNAGASITVKAFSSRGVLTNNGTITVRQGSVFSNNKTLDNKSGGVIENSGSLRNNAAGVLNNEGLLQNKAGATLRNIGALQNTGTVEIDAGSAVTDVGTFTQSAGITTVDGSMTQSSVSILGGDLTGTGTITAPVTLAGGRIVSDALTIAGDLHFVEGTLLTTIGATDFTVLSVTGTAYLVSGVFAFDFGSYIPEVGESWLFLSGLIDGDLSGYVLDIQQIGNVFFELEIRSGGLALVAVDAPTVPVPGAAWLFGSALLGLLGSRKFARR